jgi:hypothetical protein
MAVFGFIAIFAGAANYSIYTSVVGVVLFIVAIIVIWALKKSARQERIEKHLEHMDQEWQKRENQEELEEKDDIDNKISKLQNEIDALKETQKLKESGHTPLGEGVAKTVPVSGIKCSNCGSVTGTMNSFCPRCGFRLTREQKNLEDARSKLEADQKYLVELERNRALKDSETKLEKNVYVEDKVEKEPKKSKDLTAGLQDASSVAYGASYLTDVQNNSDVDTYDDDDDYDDEN